MRGRDLIEGDGDVARAVRDAVLQPVGEHWSDAEVYSVPEASRGEAFLKRAPVDSWYPLRAEVERLAWVDHRVPMPGWWEFEASDSHELLLTAALPGRSLRHLADQGQLSPQEQVELHATAVRAVHDRLPVADCPFTLSNEWQVDHSVRLHAGGQSDASYLADLTGGWSIDQAFAFLRRRPRPEHLDDVVLHGDPYGANLIVDLGSKTWGFIDWGWCGVGDRWHDLSNVYVHLERKLGVTWADAFLHEYGIARDDDAIWYFRVLDGLR